MTSLIVRMLPSLCAALLLAAPAARAEGPEIIPIEQIKPGQKGYGLTVFQGFKVERFDVEVIDVLKNFLPGQDLFLARIDHPVLRNTGVVGGMSGSPIYLEGKLAGALAYGWRFSREPVAGVTPIADMLAINKLELRGPGVPGLAGTPPGALARRMAAGGLTGAGGSGAGEPAAAAAPAADVGPLLVPMTVPLNAGGFGPEALDLLRQEFAAFGLEPVQGGGTGAAEGPARFEPGGSLAVQLVGGDMSLASTGTVTWVGGGRVLGFGHKMFGAGELHLPAASAKVVHTLANLARSFKIASPARVLGSLVQDRQAGIAADTTRTAPVIPMKITMKAPGRSRVYNLSLVDHPVVTPNLVRVVVLSALNEALPDVTHVTFTVDTRVAVRGLPQFRHREHLAASGGVPLTLTLGSQGLRAVKEIMQNPFAPVQVERIDVEIDVKFSADVVEITGVSVGSYTVEPGQQMGVQVTFRPFGGAEFSQTYPLQIPGHLDGSLVLLEVAGGASVKPLAAEPEDLGQYLKLLSRQSYSARSLVLSLKTPGEGIKLQGRVIRDLPHRVLDTLNTGTQARSEALFAAEQRRSFGTSRVVSGKKVLRLRVQRDPR